MSLPLEHEPSPAAPAPGDFDQIQAVLTALATELAPAPQPAPNLPEILPEEGPEPEPILELPPPTRSPAEFVGPPAPEPPAPPLPALAWRHVLAVLALPALLLGLLGAAAVGWWQTRATPLERYFAAQVALLEERADVLAGVQSAADLDAAREKLRQVDRRWAPILRRQREEVQAQLPQEPGAEPTRLWQAHLDRLQAPQQRLQAELQRIARLPNVGVGALSLMTAVMTAPDQDAPRGAFPPPGLIPAPRPPAAVAPVPAPAVAAAAPALPPVFALRNPTVRGRGQPLKRVAVDFEVLPTRALPPGPLVLVIEVGNPPAWQEFPWEGPAGRTSGSIVHHLAIDDHLPVALHLETGEFPQARRQRLSETVTAWLPPVAEAPPSVKPLPPLPPGPVEPLDKALADLRAGHLAGAEALVRMPVVGERRAEVVEALTTALQATDGAQAVAATQALVVWGGKLAVPALVARLRRLHDNQFVLRGALIEALGAIRDPRAAEVIARWLPRDRARAAQALKALGRDAEEEVFPLLKHPDPQVREEACGILAVIGTAVAYPKLDELIFGDSYRTVKHAANKAQEAIVKRDPRAKPPPIRIIQ